jgi:hypothetical protein
MDSTEGDKEGTTELKEVLLFSFLWKVKLDLFLI